LDIPLFNPTSASLRPIQHYSPSRNNGKPQFSGEPGVDDLQLMQLILNETGTDQKKFNSLIMELINFALATASDHFGNTHH
jgi:hypothetical protein